MIISIQTHLGLLKAETFVDPEFPGLNIWLGDRLICVAEVPNNSCPRVMVYTDPDNDSPTSQTSIKVE